MPPAKKLTTAGIRGRVSFSLSRLLVSVCFAASCVFGYTLEKTRGVSWRDVRLYLALAVIAVVAYLGISFVLAWIDGRARETMHSQAINHRFPDGVRHVSTRLSLRARLLCLGVVSLGWVVVWLASWPGYFCYDTIHVISGFDTWLFNNQQPVLHTMFCRVIMRVGYAVFGSWNGAVGLYTFVQLSVVLLLVNAVLGRLWRIGVSVKGLFFCALYYALSPAVLVLVTCSTKDVMFSAFFAYLCVTYYELLCCRSNGWHARWSYVCTTIALFVVLALRGNAPYALYVTVPLVWLINRRHGGVPKGLALSVMVALVAYFVWMGPIADAMNVYRSDARREMIGVPAVEIARCARYDDWGEQEFARAGVDREELAQSYESSAHTSDGCRALFWPLLDEDRVADFLNLWLAARRSHFSECVVADLELTEAAWYVGGVQDGYNLMGVSSYEYDTTETSTFAAWCEEPASQQSLFPLLSDAIWYISRYDTPQKNPILHVILSPASYVWLFLLFMALMFRRKDRAGQSICVFVFFLTATLLLGPMVLLRYYYHLVLLIPVFLCIAFLPPSEVLPANAPLTNAGVGAPSA